MALQNMRQKSAAVAGVVGLGAVLVGCAGSARPQAIASFGETGASAPMSVACEPNQRAIVRQAAVNGVMQSQVQCETIAGYGAVATGGFAASPVAYQPGFQPVSYAQPAALEPTQIVRTAYPQPVVTRDASPRVTSYQRAPERVVVRQPKRSVKKSAIIIGSSAGVGAGIGAAVGGKKGAGIGALLGGGGAALWDQMTRRK
jgi:hypothetical protein